jgi:hypothetical protein
MKPATKALARAAIVIGVAVALAGNAVAASPFAARRAEKEAANAALVCKMAMMEGRPENVLNAEKLSKRPASVT